jgi:hypothetical protein
MTSSTIKIFRHKNDFFLKIYLHRSLQLLMIIQDYDTWHNKKLQHGILIIFWKKLIN